MPIRKIQKGRIEEKKSAAPTPEKPAIEKIEPEIKKATITHKGTKESKTSSEYSAKNITVLEGLEAVRRRPGMYIGSTGPAGLHHLIWEVVDNSVDEAMAGHCDRIEVSLLPNHMIEVRDNGRGITVDIHPQQGVSALEVVLTKLHAGGKFGDGGYKISGGLHGDSGPPIFTSTNRLDFFLWNTSFIFLFPNFSTQMHFGLHVRRKCLYYGHTHTMQTA